MLFRSQLGRPTEGLPALEDRRLHLASVLFAERPRAVMGVAQRHVVLGLDRAQARLELGPPAFGRAAFDEGGGTVASDLFVTYVRAGDNLGRLAAGKSEEIKALQPAIQEGREDVLEKYKTKRAMEVLTSKTGEQVEQEESRADQRALDDLTSQRYRGSKRYRGSNGSGDEPQ